MAPENFKDGRSPLKPGVDEEACKQFARELASLFIQGSDIIDDLRELTRTSADYARYQVVLENLVDGYGSSIESVLRDETRTFCEKLQAHYLEYSAPSRRDVWVDALAAIIEFVYLELMRMKYSQDNAEIYHEHCPHFPAPPATPVASMVDKPIDVNAWFEALSVGEFLEVKKNLDSKYRAAQRSNDRVSAKFVSKVERMHQFAQALDQHFGTSSNVAVATLSPSPYAERLLGLSYRQAGLTRPQTGPRVEIITSSTLEEWYTRKVI
ncbi:hypothetical protein [Deinococcus sp. NW-56]|uniref:hypothetical protein n=1 Tax=Deinococcus sp. NW-56 TaxID=2080419 RepID=UPI001319DF7A|nr:hypothetical protein [Deinococcus sp. NW-56]